MFNTVVITLLSGLTRRCSRGALIVARCRVHDLGILFGLAASAMVYITLDELVPEVYAHGEGHGATLSIAFGVIAALVLMGLIWGVKRGPELLACMRFHTRGEIVLVSREGYSQPR